MPLSELSLAVNSFINSWFHGLWTKASVRGFSIPSCFVCNLRSSDITQDQFSLFCLVLTFQSNLMFVLWSAGNSQQIKGKPDRHIKSRTHPEKLLLPCLRLGRAILIVIALATSTRSSCLLGRRLLILPPVFHFWCKVQIGTWIWLSYLLVGMCVEQKIQGDAEYNEWSMFFSILVQVIP